MWLTFGPSHQLASSNESILIHRLHPSKTLKSIWHTQEAHIKQFKRNRVCKWRERERERERERGIEASDHSLQCIGSWVPLQITSWFANHQFTENLKMKI
jgi:hypothetical protein